MWIHEGEYGPPNWYNNFQCDVYELPVFILFTNATEEGGVRLGDLFFLLKSNKQHIADSKKYPPK